MKSFLKILRRFLKLASFFSLLSLVFISSAHAFFPILVTSKVEPPLPLLLTLAHQQIKAPYLAQIYVPEIKLPEIPSVQELPVPRFIQEDREQRIEDKGRGTEKQPPDLIGPLLNFISKSREFIAGSFQKIKEILARPIPARTQTNADLTLTNADGQREPAIETEPPPSSPSTSLGDEPPVKPQVASAIQTITNLPAPFDSAQDKPAEIPAESPGVVVQSPSLLTPQNQQFENLKLTISKIEKDQQSQYDNLLKIIGQSGRINSLGYAGNTSALLISSPTLNNPNFSGTATGLADDDISDDITVASSAGGSFGGNVAITGTLTVGTNTITVNGTTNIISSSGGLTLQPSAGNALTTSFLSATTTATSTFAGPIASSASDGVLILHGATTTGRLLLNPYGGNVGVGTTSPSEQLAISNRLYVGGTGTSTIENNLGILGSLSVGALCFNCGGGGGFTGGTTTVTNLIVTNVSTSTFAGGLAVQTNKLVVDNQTGNVGVGTTTPYATFAVVGQVVAEYFTATSTTASKFGGQIQAPWGSAAVPSYSFSTDTNSGLTSGGDNILDFIIGGASGATLSSTGLSVNSAGSASVPAVRFGAGSTIGFYEPSSNVLGIVTNQTEKVRIDSSGRVGIGTTTPAVALQVASTTGPQLVLTDYNGGANLKHFYASSSAGDLAFGALNDALSTYTERFRITNAGNLGIGTTSPYAKLSVVGASGVVAEVYTATSTTATTTLLGALGVGTSTPAERLATAGRLYVGGTGTSTIENNLIVRGNFQIGAGTAILTASTLQSLSGDFSLQSAGGASLMLNSGLVGVGSSTPWGKFSIEQDGNAPVFVVSDQGTSTPHLLVSGLGRVGLGTTSPSAQLALSGDLYVAGPTTTFNNIRYLWPSADGASSQFLQTNGAGTLTWTTVDLATAAGWTDDGTAIRLTLQSDTVGIGTSTPTAAKLHITSTSSPQLVLTDYSGGANLKHFYASSSAGDLAFGALNDALSTYTERFRITNAGNLGIGTTSPYAKLSVVGASGVVAEVYTATSTTATTTLLGALGVGTSTPAERLATAGRLYVGGTGTSTIENNLLVRNALQVGTGSLYLDTNSLTNLTGNLILQKTGGNKVGVGTSTPFGLLSVEHTAGNVGFVVGSSTATSFIVDAAGNVGVGTANPGSAYGVVSKLGLSNSGEHTFLDINAPSGKIAAVSFSNAGSDQWYISGRGTYDTPNNRLAIVDASSERMTILSGGNVGIGVSNPASKLHVASGNTTSATVISASDSAGDTGAFVALWSGASGISNAPAIIWSAGEDLRIGGGITDIDGGTGFVEMMRITDAGLVGIGTTTPYAALSVVGASGVVAEVYTATSTTATTTLLGALGVGTSTPAERLATAGRLYVGGAGTSTIENNLIVRGALQTGVGSTYLDTNGLQSLSGNLTVKASGANNLLLNPTGGFVGIGTTSPTYTLAVHNTTQVPAISLSATTSVYWTKRGGDAVNSSWDATYGYVSTMTTYNGKLYAGLGYGAGQGEVWEYNSASTTVWTKVGGDAVNSSWAAAADVFSMTTYNGKLYAGLGSSGAEVWEYNGSTWTQIGGDAVNSSWGTTYEYVYSMTTYNGKLYAGLGYSTGEAEVWEYNGSAWTQVGGDAVNSSWADATYGTVYSMTTYNGRLYAGLGTSAGAAEVWEYNGSSWSKIGGDAVNSSWADATYEIVYPMTTHNGKLYAGLGETAGDAEVWEYNGSAWTKVGGDAVNSSWADATYERAYSMTTYNGKLYAGLGWTAGNAEVWEYNTDSIAIAKSGTGMTLGNSLTLSRNNRVGIGTDDPQFDLDVYGNFRVGGSTIVATSSRVGFGTSTPWGLFSIESSVQTNNQTPIFVVSDFGTSTPQLLVSAAGNVGIGTTSPYARLSVVGSTGVVAQQFTATSSSATSTLPVIAAFDPTGNVGSALGRLIINAATTTGELWLNPYGGKVHIASSSPDQVNLVAGGAGFSVSTTTYFGGNVGIGTTSPASGLLSVENTGSGYSLYVTDSALDTSPFVIDASGYVGIGTSNPQDVLHIGNGSDAPAFGFVGQKVYITFNGESDLFIRDSTNNVEARMTAYSGGVILGSVTNHKVEFYQNNATKMVLDTDGEFGIGVDPPTAQLDVVTGTTGASNWAARLTNLNATNPWGLLINTAANSNSIWGLEIRNNTSRTDFVVTTAGNVGIGTSTPGTTLAVQGSAVINGPLTTYNTLTLSSLVATTSATSTFAGPIASNASDGRLIIHGATTTGELWLNPYGGKVHVASSTPSANLLASGVGFSVSTTTYFGANVGIGTTSPGGLLSVSANGTAPAFLLNQTSTGDLLTLQDGGSTVFVVKDGGNVGIGTANPGTLLDIKDTTTANTSGQNILTLQSDYIGATVGSGGRIVFKYQGGTQETADIRAYTFGTGATGLAFGTGFNAVTTKMVINNAGSVGIGTTDPQAILDVQGTGAAGYTVMRINNDQVGNTLGWYMTLASGASPGTARGYFGVGKPTGGTATIFTNETADSVGLRSEGYLYLGSGNAADMTIDTSGNVGIGTTSPGTLLSVAGSAVINGPTTLYNSVTLPSLVATTTATSTFAGPIASNASDGKLILHGATTTGELWLNPYGGKVHIASSTPGQVDLVAGGVGFSVSTTTYFGSNVGISTTTPWGRLSVEMDTTNPAFVVSNQGSSTPAFYIGGVNENGRIGIGTSSPKVTFSVGGDFLASSTSGFIAAGQQGVIQVNPGFGSTGVILRAVGTTPYVIAQLGTTNDTNSAFIVYDSLDNARFTVYANGNGVFSGNCSDAAAGGGCTADYAEVYHRDPADFMEKGDLLSLNPATGKLVRADKNNSNILGVFSSSPGSLIGQRKNSISLGVGTTVLDDLDPDEIPIALVGRVPLKVNLEGGEIKIGDPITVSSESGIGMKATKAGRIIGYALENYNLGTSEVQNIDGNSGTSDVQNIGKILVFINLSYWMPVELGDQEDLAADSSGLLAQVIDIVANWLENAFVKIKELVVEKLKIGSPEKPTGITLYDKSTGEPYCLEIIGGAPVSTPGECGTSNVGTSDVSPTSDISNIDDSPAESGSAEGGQISDVENIDTIAPTIIINGDNPTQIEVGSSYVDLGATVTDSDGAGNVNDNLSIYYQVDGVSTPNDGREPPDGSAGSPQGIDTSIPATHTITYTATDQAGNTAAATREVIVFDPYAGDNLGTSDVPNIDANSQDIGSPNIDSELPPEEPSL